MENEFGNDPNVGAAGAGSLDNSASGNQGVDPVSPTQNSGSPDGQNGQSPAQGTDELSKYKAEVRRLNQQVAKLGRSTAQKGSQNQDGQQTYGFDTPEGQYGASLQIADSNLRAGMEEFLHLYPEVDSGEVNRIRKNPWAYASREAWLSGDWEQAKQDIEYYLLDLAESGQGAGNPQNPPTNPQTPASINSNPAPTPPPTDVAPGTEDDENPWTMPLDKLEKKAKREVAHKTANS